MTLRILECTAFKSTGTSDETLSIQNEKQERRDVLEKCSDFPKGEF
jgi:hypothetical protein